MPNFATLQPVNGGSATPNFATLKPTSSASQPVPQQQQSNTNSQYATFPADSTDSVLSGSAKLLGNIPSSAFNFAKNTINFFNPMNAVNTAKDIGTSISGAIDEGANGLQIAKDTITGLPQEAYNAVTPQFIQHIVSGDFQKAADTLRNDPVGQLAPLIMIGRQAADSMGKGAEFDQAISKVASPVTVPAQMAADTAARFGGNVGSQLLGASTGAGASSIKEAFNNDPAFVNAMRGNVDPEALVQTAKDAVSNIAAKRSATYQQQLADIGKNNTASLDISPVHDALYQGLKDFNINVNSDGSLDFSRSQIANDTSATSKIQGIYDTMKSWGTQAGDRTPLGLDILKKQLGDFYSDSNASRAFVQGIKSKVSGILNDQVPGYSDMTKGYAQASQLLSDIKSATGIGGSSKIDTVFTKLTNAMKQDNALRLEVLNEVKSNGAQPDLMAQIAGSNMQTYVPKGLRGIGDAGIAIGVLTHFLSPQTAFALLTTSPRIVGEFVNALGLSAQKTNAIMNAINNVPKGAFAAPSKKPPIQSKQ